jgi:hypothetical protein
MDDAPLIPSALFGLRTWRVVADEDGECLRAAHRGTPWPGGGAWLSAACDSPQQHDAPAPDCQCGIHAWHPCASSARRVLAARAEVPGIVEAGGEVQLHEQGFRARRARPHALIVAPRRNARAIERLGRRYGVPVIEIGSPAALVAWCRDRGLGLDPETVQRMLGPDRAREARDERTRARRQCLLRAAAGVALAAALLIVGLQFLSGPPSPDGVYGRTGWVVRPRTVTAPAAKVVAPSSTATPAVRETSHMKRSTCRYGGTDHRAPRERRHRAHERAASRGCRPG